MKPKTKLVTIWSCSEWDQSLVLVGKPDATRKTAEGYRSTGSAAELKYTVRRMTTKELKALPELCC